MLVECFLVFLVVKSSYETIQSAGNHFSTFHQKYPSMVTISDYLAYILKELATARQMCDAETIRLAEIYSNDDYLRHFPAPRFKLSELELTIPIVVSDLDLEDKIDLSLSESTFFMMAKSELDNYMSRNKNLVRAESVDLLGVFSQITDWYTKLKKCATRQEFEKCFHENYIEILNTVQGELAPADITASTSLQISTEQDMTASKLWDQVKKKISISGHNLKNVLVEPDSNAVNRLGNDKSILFIKAKVVEEGVMISSVKDSAGNEKPIITIE